MGVKAYLFVERLKKKLVARKMTQAELAHRVGITSRALSLYMTGARVPRMDTLVRMAEELGVTPNDLTIEGQTGFESYQEEIRGIGSMAVDLERLDLAALSRLTFCLAKGDRLARGLIREYAKTAHQLVADRSLRRKKAIDAEMKKWSETE